MTERRRESIFIGVPCYGEVAPDILEDWMRFMYHCGRRLPQYDFHLGIRTKAEQFRARNAMVDGALQMGCDWLFMLDDDMVLNPVVTNGPTEDYGILERLIAHDKDICGALYYQRTGNCPPVLMAKSGEHGYRFLRDDEITHGLQRVDVAGGGCLLIKTKIFDKLKYPFFEPEFKFGTDIQLCRQALEKGFEVWADTSIELGHVRTERVIVTSQNRAQFQLTDGVPGEIKKNFIASDVYSRLQADAEQWTGYADFDAMAVAGQRFMKARKFWQGTDLEWYRQYPKERVARQVWFNVGNSNKKLMTEFLLSAIPHQKALDILDFGCGIGIPAFTLAEKGHRVTACDLDGTGTLDFLRWRTQQHHVPMTFHATTGGLPAFGDARFDVVIAMDCLEHIPDWARMLAHLAAHVKPGGFLFANNAVLDDTIHPEHYTLENKAFVQACMDAHLMPVNQITYRKLAPKAAETSREAVCA